MTQIRDIIILKDPCDWDGSEQSQQFILDIDNVSHREWLNNKRNQGSVIVSHSYASITNNFYLDQITLVSSS
jgi:uncharacterized membrane protein